MNHYSDPTANAAIGAVDRELKKKRKEAEKIRERMLSGQFSWEDEQRARRRFTGIFRPILEEALRGW